MGVVGSRAASVEGLEALYRGELPRFVRAASAIVGSEIGGRDVVQEGFARAVRSIASFRGEVALEAWVWRIVINTALEQRRKAGDEVALDEVFLTSENGSAEEDLGVRRWVAALPERQRLMVFLRYFAGLDYRSIAEALDVEVGTVSATLAAAHAALRRSMEEVER
jgi:RNA polymerase sigma-70 factor, ECF subfamily